MRHDPKQDVQILATGRIHVMLCMELEQTLHALRQAEEQVVQLRMQLQESEKREAKK